MNGQYSDSFYDLLINPESGRYLFRILAAKLILSQPEKYGYQKLEPFESYKWKPGTLSESIPDLPYWCRKNGFTYKCFRILNPWLKTSSFSLVDSLGPVVVKLPLNCNQYSNIALPGAPLPDSAGELNERVFRNLVNQKDIKALKAEEKPKEAEPEFHEIGPGESLSLISEKYNIPMEKLFDLNPGLKKKQHKIGKGEKLRIRGESQ
jgi:LysM repeat protein